MKIKELELKVAELQRRIELMEQREANRPAPQPLVIQPQPPPYIVPFQPYIGPTCGNVDCPDALKPIMFSSAS